MTGPKSRGAHRSDPLRTARQAVRAGQFREAWESLSAMKGQYDTHPEWLLLMAMAAWRIGKYEESHGSALKALAEYRARGDGDGEMRSLNVAAAGTFALGQLDRARSGFARALELARRYDDKIMMARCANNLGNVAYYLGERAEALHQYSLAANLFDQAGSLRGLAEAWHNAGVVLREQGELAAAREAADRAMEAAEQLGDQRALGWTLGDSAETDVLLGDLRLGGARAELAVQLAREHDDPSTEIDSLRVLALVARLEGRTATAVEIAEQAAAMAAGLNNPWMVSKTLTELGRALAAHGIEDRAGKVLSAAATTLESIGAAVRAEEARSGLRDS